MHFMILFTRHSDRAETPAHHRLEGGRVRERRWLLHGRSGSTIWLPATQEALR